MEKILFKAQERGETKIGWLNSRHSFSFGEFYNPELMGFGKLRVLNDDEIKGGSGFGMHPHSNMEIITIVIEGELAHEDSAGNKGTIKEGDIQVMRAGKGILHSEMNASKTKSGKFLQIWIETDTPDVEPAYAQKKFDKANMRNKLLLAVGGLNTKAPLKIHQNAKVMLSILDAKKKLTYKIPPKQGVFLFVVEGKAEVEGEELGERDAIGINGAGEIEINAKTKSKLLLIEVSK